MSKCEVSWVCPLENIWKKLRRGERDFEGSLGIVVIGPDDEVKDNLTSQIADRTGVRLASLAEGCANMEDLQKQRVMGETAIVDVGVRLSAMDSSVAKIRRTLIRQLREAGCARIVEFVLITASHDGDQALANGVVRQSLRDAPLTNDGADFLVILRPDEV